MHFLALHFLALHISALQFVALQIFALHFLAFAFLRCAFLRFAFLSFAFLSVVIISFAFRRWFLLILLLQAFHASPISKTVMMMLMLMLSCIPFFNTGCKENYEEVHASSARCPQLTMEGRLCSTTSFSKAVQH